MFIQHIELHHCIKLTYFISMDFFSRQNLYEKIQWVKEKGSWLLLALLTSALTFFAAFWFTILLLFLLQPEPYASKVEPQFQAKRQNNLKLFSVLQNRQLKMEFCNQDFFTYSGTSIGQEEFCNFNYQKMPRLNGPYDISMIGINSLQVRFVSVCALRLPKYRKTIKRIYNQSDYDVPALPTYKYVCQKYRAYKHFQIANTLDDIELVFLELELQLTEKGFETFDGANLRLSFEQESTAAQRLIIDYYWILAFLVALAAGIWIGMAVLVIELAVIVRRILNQKQLQQLRLLQERNRKRD